MDKKSKPNNDTVKHTPNSIPAREQAINIILSSILLLYGTFGLIRDDLYLPGKRGRGIHLHGERVWIMYVAILCAVANMMSVVIDHYDRRNNEINYKLFARVTQIAGWTIFALALLLELLIFDKGT